MKKALKIAAALAAVLLTGLVLLIYNAFNGNLISAMYAKHQITQYIHENYPDSGYRISGAHYSFKDGSYQCVIADPDSADGNFTAYYSDGTVSDSYEYAVTGKENILNRLETGFRAEIDPMIERHLHSENGIEEFGFGSVIDDDKDIDRNVLYRDMTFDVKNMPLPTHITVSLNTDAAQSFTRVRQLAQELQSLGYRIDDYSYYDNHDELYSHVPTEQLLAAQGPQDISEYREA